MMITRVPGMTDKGEGTMQEDQKPEVVMTGVVMRVDGIMEEGMDIKIAGK